MAMMRRLFLLVAVAAMAFATPQTSYAQTYPDRPIKIIVPFPPGGVIDTLVRAIGERARASLGQPWVIENKPGANGAIGLQACAMAEPDGYTFCAITAEALTISPHYEPEIYDRYKSLAPVTQFVSGPGVIYTHPDLAAKTLKELVALARTKPGELNYSSWGRASSPQLLFEWLNKKENVNIAHVPFRGSSPALNEVLAGRVSASYVALGFALPHIKEGKLKPLAVIGDERSPLLPDVPSLKELGFDFPYKGAWFGLMAPAATPAEFKTRIADAVRGAVNDAELKAKFLDPQAYKPIGSSPAEFTAFAKAENANGAEIIRVTGLKAE